MQLIVRCAVQQKDCTYEVGALWTVLQLKEHLQLQHDGRPVSSAFRLLSASLYGLDASHLRQRFYGSIGDGISVAQNIY